MTADNLSWKLVRGEGGDKFALMPPPRSWHTLCCCTFKCTNTNTNTDTNTDTDTDTDTNTIQPLVEICTSRVDGLGACVYSSLHAMCIFFISNSLLKCTKCTLAKCNNLYERCARSTVWELVCTICSMQRSYQKDWILCWNTRP